MASFSSRSSYSSGSPMRRTMLMSSSSGPSGLQAGSGSVYGGAGGFGVRISQASFNRASSMNQSVSEKATMQSLNNRLASYLEKVRSLEEANATLELNIRQFLGAKLLPEAHDWTVFQAEIKNIQNEIALASRANSSIFLAADNAKLAADDFKLKYENELAMHQMVDADMNGLRAVLGELTNAKSSLKQDIEGLKFELIKMSETHKKDLQDIQSQMGGQVNVEVDAAPQEDLSAAMDEIRRYYQGVTEKNHKDLEAWFLTKTTELNSEVSARTVTLESSKSEITDTRRIMQNLEIELESQLSMIDSLRSNLGDTQGRYGNILAGYQRQVSSLEEQLADLRAGLVAQGEEYKMLLDIKTRLELEITEYRRLLDGELLNVGGIKKQTNRFIDFREFAEVSGKHILYPYCYTYSRALPRLYQLHYL
ncbi:Keratin, type I cytoskeletal 13 [Merluccius polli]|uniref:Keratin, type I cytoskeletal 13 n=1 Tax=Merluccius polli TaxID=89951 RepID=A0AA47MPZ1_MERPO|nr:Keratin, type I cytoskeletal 13 [Merluccius polli]